MNEDDLARKRQNLQAAAVRLAERIGARDRELVAFSNVDDARPFVLVTADGAYAWNVVERGQTLDRRVTADVDEALYWALKHTSRAVASRLTREHPVEGQAFRVTLWTRQAELLHSLNPAWAIRWREEMADFLRPIQPEALSLLPSLPGDS